MLKIEVNGGNITCTINGNLSDIIVDTVRAVKSVYVSIKRQSKSGAKMYKKMFRKIVDKAFEDDETMQVMSGTPVNEGKDPLEDFHAAARDLLEDMLGDD